MNVNPSAIVRAAADPRHRPSARRRPLRDRVADLLLALTSDEATSRLLTSLGVEVTAVRDTLERTAPPD